MTTRYADDETLAELIRKDEEINSLRQQLAEADIRIAELEDVRKNDIDEYNILSQQLSDADESLKAVERELMDVDYSGRYADGVRYLKEQLVEALSHQSGLIDGL